MKYSYLFDEATKRGISELQLYIAYNKQTNINTNNDILENYTISEIKSYNIKGLYNGKMGKIDTEILNESNVSDLINKLIENASNIDSDDIDIINKEIIKIKGTNNNYKIDANKKVTKAFEIYKKLKRYSKHFANINIEYVIGEYKIDIINSHGLELSDQKQYISAVFQVVVKNKDLSSTDFDYYICFPKQRKNDLEICKIIVDKAIDKLRYRIIKTGDYSIIIENKVVANMLSAMKRNFYGNVIQENRSYLKDKINNVIASPNITIIEKPNDLKLIGSRLFDDEGVKTYKKFVVKNGVFKTVLYNLKSGLKNNTDSTGNGYFDANNTGVRNLYIKEGIKSLNDMFKGFTGVYITNLTGLHSGINQTNGDFSLQAEGYEIINGKKKQATKLIVLSGNFFDMLKDVIEVGSDLRFVSNIVGAPSLKIGSLHVSGM